jgi:hypothetical protein
MELNDLQRKRRDKFAEESARLGHAIQTGVRMEIELGLNNAHEPKHLRVGVNQALIETGALGWLLIKKGLITDQEYYDSILELMRKEVISYERRLSLATGHKVTLG